MAELIARARKYESQRDLETAFTLYTEALDIMIEQSKTTKNPVTLQHLKSEITNTLTHTEKLKETIEQQKARERVNRSIIIEENSINHDLSDMFTPYLENCSRVIISDPYLGQFHQVRNLHYFCDTLLNHKQVNMLIIETNPESSASEELKILLENFEKKQNQFKIYLITASLIHDREITFCETPKAGQGEWVARMGRGLDIYQKVGKYEPGWQNYKMRKCKECVIEVYYKRFNLQEFNKLKKLLHEIKDIGEESRNLYDKHKNNKRVCEDLLTQQLFKLDNLVIPSNYRYAKAVKKQTINNIHSYTNNQ